MTYYNPYNSFVQAQQYTRPVQPVQQRGFQPNYTSQMPQFDSNQFKKIVPQLNDNLLSQFVLQARAQGISDADIQKGLELINSLK